MMTTVAQRDLAELRNICESKNLPVRVLWRALVALREDLQLYDKIQEELIVAAASQFIETV